MKVLDGETVVIPEMCARIVPIGHTNASVADNTLPKANGPYHHGGSAID